MANNTTKPIPKGKVKFDITLSDEQKQAKSQILEHPYNFIIGKTGTGKTLLSVNIALDMYFTRKVNKIIITRPTVSNEDNGYLPGSLSEKMEPWLVPIRSNMQKTYNKKAVLTKMETDEKIELVSLNHFRGRTFEDAVCIVDEFQNLTKTQLAMAIGRLGIGSTMIFTGDFQQIDLKYPNDSAIHEISKLKDCQYVHIAELVDNHRHEALNEVLNVLANY